MCVGFVSRRIYKSRFRFLPGHLIVMQSPRSPKHCSTVEPKSTAYAPNQYYFSRKVFSP